MRYFMAPASLLAAHGLGGESWRRHDSKGNALTNETEATRLMGYESADDLAREKGVREISIAEAKKIKD